VNVSFSRALARAWERTRRALFDARDWPERWFVTGFAAFLAGIVGYGTSWQYRIGPWNHDHVSVRELTGTLIADATLLALLGGLSIVGLALYALFLWISSRGKFVFLDNVAADRPAIVEPWRRFAPQGNSLFLWRLVFTLLSLAAVAAVVGPALVLGGIAGVNGSWIWGLGGAFLAVAAGTFLGIVAACVHGLLDGFVVPIMYRDGIRTNEAWRKFLPLLRDRPAEFALYGLLLLVLGLFAAIAVTLAGFLTCCVGFVLLAIPYLGTVVLLPVWFTYRAFGPEFLAEFGPEWTIFPTVPASETPPPPPPPPAPEPEWPDRGAGI